MSEIEPSQAEIVEMQGAFVRAVALRLAPVPGLAEEIEQRLAKLPDKPPIG